MNSPIKEKKDALRALYLEKRKSLSSQTLSEYEEKIVKTVLSLASFRHSEIVLFYAPIKNEIPLDRLLSESLALGKAVAFPRCHQESYTMSYHFITSWSDLVPGTYGILEPREDAPVYDLKDSRACICFVPGLSFDKYGYRLGYGRGYYDKFMRDFNGSKIGVIASDFISDRLPIGKYDYPVDALLTETGIKPIKKQK